MIKKKTNEITKNTRFLLSNNKDAIRFILIFLSINIPLYLLFYAMESHFDFLRFWTAQATATLSHLVGLPVKLIETRLITGNLTLEIIHECTGIFAMMITISGISAYPTTWKKKTVGILMLVPSIILINLARLLFLIYICQYHKSLFTYAHSYFWQGSFIIAIILLWFLWIELVVQHEKQSLVSH